jgi:hypothetical protein
MDRRGTGIMARSKTESEGEKQKRDMQDLKSKSDGELQELLERQTRILSQKYVKIKILIFSLLKCTLSDYVRGLVAKLADKGERVQTLRTRIEQELASREEVSKLGGTLAHIQLTDNMEWNLAAGEDRLKSQERSSDPLLNFLQLKNEYRNTFIMDK